HFQIFCLAAAGIERQNHGLVVGALVEQITTALDALDRLEAHGFAFPGRQITVLASDAKAALGDRIAEAISPAPVTRTVLDHPYYDGGLRFQIATRTVEGVMMPLVDGGAFTWVAKLTSNRRAVFVATGLGSQLVALLYSKR